MVSHENSNLLKSSKIIIVIGYLLGLTGILALMKPLFTEGTLWGTAVMIIVGGATICVAWMVIEGEKKMVGRLSKTPNVNEEQIAESMRMKKSELESAADKAVVIANRLFETRMNAETGKREVVLTESAAADYGHFLTQVSHHYRDLAEAIDTR